MNVSFMRFSGCLSFVLILYTVLCAVFVVSYMRVVCACVVRVVRCECVCVRLCCALILCFLCACSFPDAVLVVLSVAVGCVKTDCHLDCWNNLGDG